MARDGVRNLLMQQSLLRPMEGVTGLHTQVFFSTEPVFFGPFALQKSPENSQQYLTWLKI